MPRNFSYVAAIRPGALIAGGLLVVITACAPDRAPERAGTSSNSDAAFAAVQDRGAGVMGVDQYTSQHIFEDFPNGGRVVLDRDDAADTVAIATIRAHMRDIQRDFASGDFSKPFGVHAQAVPGTDVMAANRQLISYVVVDRDRGAELRMTTTDSATVAAIHRFLAFQRMDHRASGHEGHDGHEGHH